MKKIKYFENLLRNLLPSSSIWTRLVLLTSNGKSVFTEVTDTKNDADVWGRTNLFVFSNTLTRLSIRNSEFDGR